MRSLIAGAVAIFIFAGVAFPRADRGGEDCYNSKGVRSWVELPLGGPEGITFLERTIYRSGDRIALGIVHGFTQSELLDPVRVRRILSVVRLSFSQPKYITRAEDKDPAVTMLLLSFLESREVDPSLKQTIRDTEDYVSKQTEAEPSTR